MRIVGVDFTSAPKREKPIVVADCEANENQLVLNRFLEFRDWPAYELWLGGDDEWVGGFDFPFGLPRRFVESQGWPANWSGMVRACAAMGKEMFATIAMQAFQKASTDKDKHRETDLAADSHSPLKTRTNPPVGLMFYEGAWRLFKSDIHIPALNETGSRKVAVEAYPGLLVKRLRERYYKNDSADSATANMAARRRLLEHLRECDSPALSCAVLCTSKKLIEQVSHKSGDWLDAVLCAAQAHSAWVKRDLNYGLPQDVDPVEGWIVTA